MAKLKIDSGALAHLAHEDIAAALLDGAGVLDVLPTDEGLMLGFLGLRQLSFDFGGEPDFLKRSPISNDFVT